MFPCKIHCVAQEQLTGGHNTSANDNHLQVKQINQVYTCQTEPAAGFCEHFKGDSIAADCTGIDLFACKRLHH